LSTKMPSLTRRFGTLMLFGMEAFRRLRPARFRPLTAVFAVLVLVVVSPLQAAHHHNKGSAADHVHAPCPACQLHAQPSTPAEGACGVVATPGSYTVHAVAPETLPSSIRPTPAGCRAPPFPVAI
jgi:hypothetical protein